MLLLLLVEVVIVVVFVVSLFNKKTTTMWSQKEVCFSRTQSQFIYFPPVFCSGLVQKQTSEVEEAEEIIVRGIRKSSEMEQTRENSDRKDRGKQKRRGLGQLITKQAEKNKEKSLILHKQLQAGLLHSEPDVKWTCARVVMLLHKMYRKCFLYHWYCYLY